LFVSGGCGVVLGDLASCVLSGVVPRAALAYAKYRVSTCGFLDRCLAGGLLIHGRAHHSLPGNDASVVLTAVNLANRFKVHVAMTRAGS